MSEEEGTMIKLSSKEVLLIMELRELEHGEVIIKTQNFNITRAQVIRNIDINGPAVGGPRVLKEINGQGPRTDTGSGPGRIHVINPATH